MSKTHTVAVADIKGGWLSSNLENIPVLNFDGNKITLTTDDVLIVTANFVRHLDLYFAGNFKIISWVVQGYNLAPQLPRVGAWQNNPFIRSILKYSILFFEYRYLIRQIQYLSVNKSLYLMDHNCLEVIEHFFRKKIVPSGFLQVIIPQAKIHYFKTTSHRPSQQSIRALWLGRLDGKFKNPILIRVIADLEKLCSDKNYSITIQIVGNGPGKEELVSIAKSFTHLKVEFMGEHRGDELKKIISSSNIGFAMGTSALEIAAYGIPTILLDYSYKSVSEEYRYKWLFNSINFTLGSAIDLREDITMGNNLRMTNVINELITDYDPLSKKCYQYVVEFHTELALSTKLTTAVKETRATFQELKKRNLMKKPIWYLFKKHKIE